MPEAIRVCAAAACCWPAGSGSLRLWLADAAGVRVTRPAWPVTSGSRAGEESEDFADGRFLAGWLPQGHVGLDLVAVAAAVFLLQHVPGCGEIGDEAVGAALGDAQAGR